jgi:hypothetical protein
MQYKYTRKVFTIIVWKYYKYNLIINTNYIIKINGKSIIIVVTVVKFSSYNPSCLNV